MLRIELVRSLIGNTARNRATIQALGSNLDPDFHFVKSVTPFAERLIKEQLEPTALARSFASTFRSAMRSMQSFPEAATKALKRIGDGSLSVTVRPAGLNPIIARVEIIADRLAFALVVASFVVGLSFLLTRSDLPWFLEVIAGVVLVCSFGVGFFFFVSILFRFWRKGSL